MDKPAFILAESPDHPGWMTWELSDSTRFNSFLGPLLVKLESGIALVRMMPLRAHSNLQDNLHGGALAGFVDVALFGASRLFGVIEAGTAVTLDLSMQFIGAGKMDTVVEAQVELLRETGRLLFLRGLVVQNGAAIASFSGTIRKPTRRT